jgi:hypothetical protein
MSAYSRRRAAGQKGRDLGTRRGGDEVMCPQRMDRA